MAALAKTSPSFNRSCVSLSVPYLTEKLGDEKLRIPAGDTLTAFAENTSLEFVLQKSPSDIVTEAYSNTLQIVYAALATQKASGVFVHAIMWIGDALFDFGMAGLQLPDLVKFLEGCLRNTSAVVRHSASLVIVASWHIGGQGA